MSDKDQQLQVDLTDGLLTISIGVSEMIGHLRNLGVFGVGTAIEVVDEDAFARSLIARLESADDRGITWIHCLLGEVAREANERGADGVRAQGGA